MRAESPANSAVAPTVPSLLYIAGANRGNPAAKDERSALFPAIAEAASGRYAVTRYVKVEVKTHATPKPNGTDPIMGRIQWTPLNVVNATQNNPESYSASLWKVQLTHIPTETRIPPGIPSRSVISGGGVPWCFACSLL